MIWLCNFCLYCQLLCFAYYMDGVRIVFYLCYASNAYIYLIWFKKNCNSHRTKFKMIYHKRTVDKFSSMYNTKRNTIFWNISVLLQPKHVYLLCTTFIVSKYKYLTIKQYHLLKTCTIYHWSVDWIETGLYIKNILRHFKENKRI